MAIFAAKENKSTSLARRRPVSAHSLRAVKLHNQQSVLRQMVQASLRIGHANDPFEQEANRVADRVVSNKVAGNITPVTAGQLSAVSPTLQKQSEVETELKPAEVQRQVNEEEEPVQTKRNDAQSVQTDAQHEAGINHLKAGGQALEPSTRNFFEARFGLDFSQVRVHQGTQAADLSRSMNARAFTTGNHIAFAEGEYQPATREGQRLLGHELTHVVQQKGSSQQVQRKTEHVLENDPASAPSISCPIANSSPAGYSLDIHFAINSSELSAGSIGAVENFVNNWHASGGPDDVRVDGYASIDGSPAINWPLSCARAHALAYELMTPSRGVPGIPSNRISMFAQGETDQFSTALAPNRLAQAHISFLPPSNPLNIADRRYSALRKYVYGRGDATQLYGLTVAPNLVPASGFNLTATSFTDYTQQWNDGLGITRLNQLGGDCGRYARELISLTGRAPDSYSTSRPGIGLTPASNLNPGEAYYISPQGTGAGAVEEDVLSPWNNRQVVRKHLTNFHVATVVARDDSTVITSEVNAAFYGRVRPWFSMYQGNAGFYRTYRREYRRGSVNPGLWRM